MADADPTQPPATGSGRVRLEYLDGIRGLTALYVVIHHVGSHVRNPSGLGRAGRVAYEFTLYGTLMVTVFIVLSGYCLMMPVSRGTEGRLARGFGDFFRRRCRRILPPYYAAMALSLAMIALFPALHAPKDSPWRVALPAFTPGVLLSHVAMVHNINPDWRVKIDPPMWSVATEWQIYLVFPLLLLVRRRGGTTSCVIAAAAVGAMLGVAGKVIGGGWIGGMAPWLLGVFAIGAAAADVSFSPRFRWAERRVPWPVLAALFGVGGLVVDRVLVRRTPADYLMGVAAASLMIACTRRVRGGDRGPLVRVLESRPVIALGAFSYSLYLVHYPLISLCDGLLARWPLGPDAQFAALAATGVPLSLAVSYAFFLLVERRFLPGRPQTLHAIAAAEVASPAP